MSSSTHDAIYAAAVANGITEGAALVAYTMGYTAVQSMVYFFLFCCCCCCCFISVFFLHVGICIWNEPVVKINTLEV